MKKKVSKKIEACDNQDYENPYAVHQALKPYLGYLLHKSGLIFKTRGSVRLEALGLQGYHFAALLIIDAGPTTNQIQICTETGVDKATMVKTIDHLEDLGLVERRESKSDRRVKTLHLTKKGANILEKAKKIRVDYEKDFLSNLDAGEAEQLKKLLLKLIENP